MTNKLILALVTLLASGLTCLANDKVKASGGILHGREITVNKHALSKFASGAVNIDRFPLQTKLERLKLRAIRFEDAPLDGVLKALKLKIRQAGGPKVNFFLKATPAQRKTQITLDLEHVPATDAIRYVCMASGMIAKYDEHVIQLQPAPPGYKY